ncbi:MAG: type VI secretion system tip protein VgrG [Gammaproteobacteria bacterium]|nr:type VI secretion system tip protein VgrG [Gammaproteobacteria bacterium]
MAIQATRQFEIFTSLGDDFLILRRLTGHEEIGRLFEYRAEVTCDKNDVSLDDLLGTNVSIRIDHAGGGKRYINGIVSEFSQGGATRRQSTYHLTISPWFWLLTRRSDCRIFQEKTVPEIIKEVFRDAGFSDFDERLSGSYRNWEYCVQYRETDFNFASRLMEQEGIYYYFTHEKGKHKLVLADDLGAHSSFPGYDKVPFFPPEGGSRAFEEHIGRWRIRHSVQPSAVAMRDYNFKTPSADLAAEKAIPRQHEHSDGEIYDYPGEYTAGGEGSTYARVRAEQLHADYARVNGYGDARGLCAGHLFNLEKFPRDDQNKEYLIIATDIALQSSAFETGEGSAGEAKFSCSIEAIDSSEQFRPHRATPKPVVQGPQTAIVVGPSGDEIYTDEFGRVKVQFHWDRKGENNENSSCWIRVSHPWAGKNWGMVHLPRIGHEVIIGFLEGDPDRPIITGRVYHADNKHPYELPANKTQSGIKTRSSKDGSGDNFNEIRFEDKKGSEQMYVHAEKNQDVVVENNQTIAVGVDRAESIGRDRTLDVGRDKSETVGRNKSIQVAAAHSEQIGANMSITVGSSLTESVAINYSETVGAAMELTVGAAYAISVGGTMSVTVGGAISSTVGGNRTDNIGGNKTISVSGDASQTVGKDQTVEIAKDVTEKIGGKVNTTIDKEQVVNAKKIQFVAKDEIKFKTGSAELIMKKNGDVTIKGGKINVKGSGNVIIKGSQIKEN